MFESFVLNREIHVGNVRTSSNMSILPRHLVGVSTGSTFMFPMNPHKLFMLRVS